MQILRRLTEAKPRKRRGNAEMAIEQAMTSPRKRGRKSRSNRGAKSKTADFGMLLLVHLIHKLVACLCLQHFGISGVVFVSYYT